jgi:Animal haem peroxidase
MKVRSDGTRLPGGRVEKVSRRRFLGGVGSTAIGAAAAAGCAGGSGAFSARPGHGTDDASATFSRMFPRLHPFAEDGEGLRAALVDIGKPGGLLDAQDDLSAGPVELITNEALRANNPDNPTHTAGTTFFGQFVDHDLTFDATSPLGVVTDPRETTNGRTPTLDLDSLYGGGPVASPQLYGRDRTRLRIADGGLFEDVPRDHDGRAVIADPRNDENLMISGLQAAFILFHNAVVDIERQRDRGAGRSRSELFADARRRVTWHYQWMVVNEYLPQIVGQEAVDQALRDRRHFRPRRAVMPVEFQGAAYRFGHSMVRPSYRANLAGDDGEAFFGMIFQSDNPQPTDPVDLRAGVRAPRRFVGWQTFFDFGDGEVKRNKLIDAKLSTPLFDLPLSTIATGDPPTSLATRNLLRHITWSQPSGQEIATVIGAAPLTAGDLGELQGYGVGLERSTPLWYYVLKEAEVVAGGLTLGPVGACIVAECIIGVLQLDRKSYLQRRRWRPDLPTRSGAVTGDFAMVDLLTLAGVDPASRGQ